MSRDYSGGILVRHPILTPRAVQLLLRFSSAVDECTPGGGLIKSLLRLNYTGSPPNLCALLQIAEPMCSECIKVRHLTSDAHVMRKGLTAVEA